MTIKIVLLRCNSCGAVNRIPEDRIHDRPRCGKCKKPLEYIRFPVEGTAANFNREALQWPGAVLIEFWSPRCGHCLRVAPVLDEIARERSGRLKIVKVNIENEPSLGSRFQIRGTPAFLLFRNGIKLANTAGALPKVQLEAWIDSALLA
jgi:thioredoxin 2